MPNHFTLTFFLPRRRDVSCSHSNRDLFTCEDNMLFSHVKISCFRAKAHLVFHWYLYNKFVYVIGLHAVQFGNNWMRKIPWTAKLDEAVGRVQFSSPRNFLNPIISKLDKHVVLLPINYRASKNSLFKAKLNVRAKTIQFILNWTVCKN